MSRLTHGPCCVKAPTIWALAILLQYLCSIYDFSSKQHGWLIWLGCLVFSVQVGQIVLCGGHGTNLLIIANKKLISKLFVRCLSGDKRRNEGKKILVGFVIKLNKDDWMFEKSVTTRD